MCYSNGVTIEWRVKKPDMEVYAHRKCNSIYLEAQRPSHRVLRASWEIVEFEKMSPGLLNDNN